MHGYGVVAADSGRRATLAGAAVVLGLTISSPATALTVIDNGLSPPNPSNVIDATDPPGESYRIVSDLCAAFVPGFGCTAPPPLSTQVEMQFGADVGTIEAVGNSALSVFGGSAQRISAGATTSILLSSPVDDAGLNSLGDVQAFDRASIHVQQAFLAGLSMNGDSTLNHRGIIHGIVDVTDQASMWLQGIATPTGSDSGVFLSGSGSLTMVSGWITDNGLEAREHSSIEVLGGVVDVSGATLHDQAQLLWRGGEISELQLFGTSATTIVGGSFAVDGVPVDLGAIEMTAGVLTGILANGDLLSVPFDRESGASLFLVPEPSTFSMLALGIAGLAGRSRAPRRRAVPGHQTGDRSWQANPSPGS